MEEGYRLSAKSTLLSTRDSNSCAIPQGFSSRRSIAVAEKVDANSSSDDGQGSHRRSLSGKELWRGASSKLRIKSVLGAFRTLSSMCEDCYIEPSLLEEMKYLGEGSFAKVVQCLYRAPWGPTEVAVKRLKPKVLGCKEDVENFIREGRLCLKLRHKNIVETLGLGSNDKLAGNNMSGDLDAIRTESPHDEWYIVQELMNHGALKGIVMEQAASPSAIVYTKLQALQWASQVAQGMAYLHSANPKVIHRDLKLDNVLVTKSLDGRLVAKIADFGLSALVPQSKLQPPPDQNIYSGLKSGMSLLEKTVSAELFYQLGPATGSLLNMAPEVLEGSPYNEKADVFSLAIIMYELFQGSLMVSFVPSLGTAVDVEIYAYNVMGGSRPPVPESWPSDLKTLIKDCWDHDPRARPSMKTISSRIHNMIGQEFWKNPDLKLGTDHVVTTSEQLCDNSSTSAEDHVKSISEQLCGKPSESAPQISTSTEKLNPEVTEKKQNKQFPAPGCMSFFRRIISPLPRNLEFNQ